MCSEWAETSPAWGDRRPQPSPGTRPSACSAQRTSHTYSHRKTSQPALPGLITATRNAGTTTQVKYNCYERAALSALPSRATRGTRTRPDPRPAVAPGSGHTDRIRPGPARGPRRGPAHVGPGRTRTGQQVIGSVPPPGFGVRAPDRSRDRPTTPRCFGLIRKSHPAPPVVASLIAYNVHSCNSTLISAPKRERGTDTSTF